MKVHPRLGKPHAAGRGIDVVLAAKREQARTPELFTALNIDPTAKKLLVVKSTQHFSGSFTPISSEILYSTGPGALAGDVTTIPYTRVATQCYWPFVADPFAGEIN